MCIRDRLYTVFHKIGTPLYFGNNFFKCWSISVNIRSVYSLGNLLSGHVVCDCIFYKYSLYSVIWWSLASRLSEVRQVVCRHLDEQTFTSLIPALRWMVSRIETYCLREIFCPILSSTPITSHFNRMGPWRFGLAKLSNFWKSRRQTSFHQMSGHPRAPI